jgi:hypothetical protein
MKAQIRPYSTRPEVRYPDRVSRPWTAATSADAEINRNFTQTEGAEWGRCPKFNAGLAARRRLRRRPSETYSQP